MRNPFRIEGPAVISVSGGRTSGLMLYKIIEAYDGKLPPDIVPIYANTGKEEEATLVFLKEQSERWSVPIVWVEYAEKEEGTGKKQFKVVNFDTASRNGEPFATLITERKFLPNAVARFCTSELKIRAMHRYIRQVLGWEEWISCVGIRADEQRRVAKLAARRGAETPDECAIAPLADAGITVADVGAFWKAQPFDLGLPNMNGRTMHGNCDLCFLKGADQVLALIREKPSRALWWIEQEKRVESLTKFKGDGARFRNDRPSYRQMHDMALNHGELFAWGDDPIECIGCTD